MPPTLYSLIESNNRLADATLGQSHAINKLADSFERLRPSFEGIRKDLYDIKADRDIDLANLESKMGSINERLALILDTVKTSEGDLKQVARDVTSPGFRIEKETSVERIISRFESLKTSTKILIVVLVIIAGMSGWLTHFLAG